MPERSFVAFAVGIASVVVLAGGLAGSVAPSVLNRPLTSGMVEQHETLEGDLRSPDSSWAAEYCMPQTVMGNLSWASSDGSSVEIYVLSAAGTGYPQTSPAASTGEHTFQFYVGGSAVWTTPPASASAVVAITVSYGVTFLLSGTTVPAVGSFCPP